MKSKTFAYFRVATRDQIDCRSNDLPKRLVDVALYLALLPLLQLRAGPAFPGAIPTQSRRIGQRTGTADWKGAIGLCMYWSGRRLRLWQAG